MPEYDYLLKPLTVAGLTLKNRLLSAPTSMAELGPDEHYTDENFDYYRLRAAGGAALVTVGDVIVDNATGRSHPQQLGMDDPSVISTLNFCRCRNREEVPSSITHLSADLGWHRDLVLTVHQRPE